MINPDEPTDAEFEQMDRDEAEMIADAKRRAAAVGGPARR